MHVQVVNFNLKGMNYEEYRATFDPTAPIIADLPGLISKVWLENKETNTYGGVLLWRDREAMAAAMQIEPYLSLPKHPNLANIVSKDFGVTEAPTRLTRGFAEAIARR
jgi:hypothetical protein